MVLPHFLNSAYLALFGERPHKPYRNPKWKKGDLVALAPYFPQISGKRVTNLAHLTPGKGI
ncbi:hypothetical protein D3C73_1371810 [compost metagenome]